MMGKWGNSGFQPHIRLVALTLELDRTSYIVEMIIPLRNMSVLVTERVRLLPRSYPHLCIVE